MKFWYLIEKDVVDAILDFFCSTSFPKGYNTSLIDLIPKVLNEKGVKDFFSD